MVCSDIRATYRFSDGRTMEGRNGARARIKMRTGLRTKLRTQMRTKMKIKMKIKLKSERSRKDGIDQADRFGF